MTKLNSHNEWDKLKEVIVGSAEGTVATLTWLSKEPIPKEIFDEAKKLAKDACPDYVMEEVKEDLDNLAKVLQNKNIC